MRILSLMALILLLTACGNQPIRPDKQQYPGLPQAQNWYQQGQYSNAALAYEQLYQHYRRPEFALLAADSWLQEKNYDNAKQQLSLIQSSSQPLFHLLHTQLSLLEADYSLALWHIKQVPNTITGRYRPRYLSLQADLDFYQQDYLHAALLLIELSQLKPHIDYSNQIINNLLLTTEQQLNKALFQLDVTELQQGWLEAAYLANTQDNTAIRQWRQRWANHPAQAFFLQNNHYQNIAVLLPLSGKYKNISTSIQHGMMAALYKNGASQQQLTFFDTGAQGQNFSYAWYGAIESGADFIVGPLLKSSIKQLQLINSSTVPVMLLNTIEAVEGENISDYFQFALSPEDEVRNVAERLIAENKKRIMLLGPESESGRKLARKFENDLLSRGGQVVSYEFYPASANDYSLEIKKALGINESVIRARRLQSILSHKLKTAAQIRPDIDAIFILAKPKQARLIKPQLKFYQAENVPVYSTSQILSPIADAALNKDLNGIKFCQSAFVIDPSSMQELLNFNTDTIKDNTKYFAFGYDAIAINSRLEWMQKVLKQKVQGLSGLLSVDAQGKLHRDLAWAQFNKGIPTLLPSLASSNPGQEQ